jgi:hypothetical protein
MKNIRIASAALLASFISFISFPLVAQEPPPVNAVRLNAGERITLDGTLSAPAWQRAPVFKQFVEHSPNRERPAKYETQVQVLYDEHALYVGVTALDPQPAQIREALVRHDFVNRTQDFVVLYVDPVGQKKSAQFFRIGAAGSTADGLHTADNDNEDFSPDFDFDAASKRTDTGYTAVFRVPYASLRFSSESTQNWRIMVGRRIPREQFTLDLSVPLPREASNFIANMQKLEGFTPPAAQNFVVLRPTVTVRQTREDNAGVRTRDSEVKPSLDIKWRPRAELVVDATLNPDFSQVELDVPQLARNTRFALFLSEKRPVFLESNDLLTSPTDALYTRTINDPRWAMRASWRGSAGAGSVAGTAITAHDQGGGLTLLPGPYGTGAALQPGNNSLMSRVRFDTHDFAFGGLLTHRTYENGAGVNSVGGADGNWQITPNLRIRGQLLASRTTALSDAMGYLAAATAQNGARLYTGLNHRTDAQENSVTLDVSDPEFRNDAGFVTQTGIRKIEAEHKRKWEQVGPFNEFQAFIYGQHTQDRATGKTVSTYITPGIYFSAARNTEFNTELRAFSRLRSDAGAPLVSERYMHFWGQTSASSWAPIVSAELDIGKLADVSASRARTGFKVSVSGKLRPLARLELEPSINRLALRREDAAGGGNALQETAAQLLAIYHLAPKQSLRVILQNSTYARTAEPQANLVADRGKSSAQSLTYAWRKSAGSVLYVGASRNTGGFAPQRILGTEAFVKWQADVGEWLGW